MADIEKYGDLDSKELLEFLAEIKSDDEDIEEAERIRKHCKGGK